MIETLLNIFTALLVVGYIGINFIAKLPAFLIGENIVYAALYLLALIYRNRRPTPALLTALAAFNAGRVSRSIISPRGEVGYLALEHVPLLTVIAVTLILALAKTLRTAEA